MPDRRSLTDRIGLSLCGRGDPAGPSVSPTPPGLSPHVQARVEAVLDAPVRVEAAQPPVVDPRALWDRMEAHGYSPERGGAAGRHQLRHAIADHEWQAHPVGEGAQEAARGPVPADGGGAGGPLRGQGAGLEEGRAQRDGGARRWRAGGPTVVRVPGNGHHTDETSEGRQSLCSWAGFPGFRRGQALAGEPVKPKGRSGKPQPATASLFEWALGLEQQREAELVGAGR